MKQVRRFLSIFMAALLLTAMFIVPVQAKRITFAMSYHELTLPADGRYPLKLITNKDYASDDLVWNSSNNQVAKVSQAGMVVTRKPGVAYITVTDGVRTAECRLTVQSPLKKIALKSADGSIGGYSSKKTKVYPVKATADCVLSIQLFASTYGASTLSVYNTLGDCLLSTSVNMFKEFRTYFCPVSAGTYNIELTSKDMEYSMEVHQNQYQSIQPTRLTIDKTSLMLIRGNKITLHATVKPKYTSEALMWSSSNKNVASISNKGVVKAANLGKAIISASCGKLKKSCSVVVNKMTTTAIVGRSTSFAKYVKQISNYTSGTWSSSNSSIATVTKTGTVTGKKPGVAYLVFKAKDGTTYTIDTTFENVPVTFSSLGLSNEDGYRYVEVKIQNKTNKRITWIYFDILQYDRYGRRLKAPDDNYWYAEGLAPREVKTDWYYWVNSNTARVAFNVTKVYFEDGAVLNM